MPVFPPGRGLRADTAIETHIALLIADTSGQGQSAALTAIGESATTRDAAVPRAQRPFRVDVLPSRLTFDDAWKLALDSGLPLGQNPLLGLIGLGGDELSGYAADLSSGVPTFIAAGPPKSGRSTLLLTMARSFLAQGAELIIAAPRPSPLRNLADEPGVRQVFTGTELSEEDLTAALQQRTGPVVVVVDDGELLRECEAKNAFRQLINEGANRGQALLLGGDADGVCSGFLGWQVDAKRGRQGALLSPQNLVDGELIGTRLARSAVGGQIQPGRALLHLGDGQLVTVQVPVG